MPIQRDVTLKKAETLLRQGKLDAAIAEYARLVSAYPGDWTSVNALGDLYFRAGRTEQAVGQFARVADHLLREGSLSKAAAIYRKIQRIDPRNPQAARGLAIIAEREDQQTEAGRKRAGVTNARRSSDPEVKVTAAREALAAQETELACTLLIEAADLYELNERVEDALAVVAEAASIDPGHPAYRLRMLRLLIGSGAIEHARRVALTVPELVLVADALEERGRREDALSALCEAANLDPEYTDLRGRLVRELAASGDLDRSRELARTVPELLSVADALQESGRHTDAIQVLDDALHRDLEQPDVRTRLVRACVEARDFERGRSVARTPAEWLLLAEALRVAGHESDALESMNQAVQRDPGNEALRAEFLRACVAAGNGSLAMRTARSTPELLGVADAMDGRGDLEAGRAVRLEAARRDPVNRELRLRVAADLTRAGDLTQAQTLLRTAADLVHVADSLLEGERPQEVLALLDEAARRDPENVELRRRVARQWALRGDVERARSFARGADELLALAEVLTSLARRAEALQLMDEAAGLDPGNMELRQQVIREHAQAGNVEEARRLAQSAADLLVLASLLKEQGRIVEARECRTTAARHDPSNAALRLEVAREWMQAGDLAQVRALLRHAHEFVEFADQLHDAGRREEALALLTEAADLEPENADVRLRLLTDSVAAGNLVLARRAARTVPEMVMLADLMHLHDRGADARVVLEDALQREPADSSLRARLASESLDCGEVDRCRRCLSIELAGDDPELLVLLGRLELVTRHPAEAREAFMRLLTLEPAMREAVLKTGWSAADEIGADGPFAAVDVIADAAALRHDWQGAVSALTEFITRVPHHIPALMKLIEVCVDGGLVGTMQTVQEQLVDAYLESGLGSEARVIAEDLVLRAPWRQENMERLRRALRLLDVADPDAVIAERLAEGDPLSALVDIDSTSIRADSEPELQ